MRDWRKTIERIMGQRGLNAKQLSRLAGRGETFVRDALDYEKNPRIDNVLALCDALGITISELFEDSSPPFQSVPIIGTLNASEKWSGAAKGEVLLRVEGGDAVAVRVDEEGMLPVYRPGDILIGSKRAGTSADNLIGLDCIILTEDGERYVRYIGRGAARGRFNLRSHNPAQHDIENVRITWAAPIIWVKRSQ